MWSPVVRLGPAMWRENFDLKLAVGGVSGWDHDGLTVGQAGVKG